MTHRSNNRARTARSAFENHWHKTTGVERGRLITKLADAVTSHAEELAVLEARDTGKPLKQAKVDATVAARYFEYYAGAADKLHGVRAGESGALLFYYFKWDKR